ncbi:putative holin-like toxin [Tissierella carlieri]
MINMHETISLMIQFAMLIISLLSFIVILVRIIVNEKK